MKTLLHASWLVAFIVMLSVSSIAQSGCTYPQAANYDPDATIEDGSCQVYDCYPASFSIDFEKTDFSNAASAENQDWITDDVRIARGNEHGLYNAFTDPAWDDSDDGPQNTLWKAGEWEAGDDPLATYQTWRDHHGGNAQSLPFTTSTVFLIDHDLYFQIEWTSWTCCNNGGGFAYIRTLVNEASDCNLIDAIYGCTNPIADNYDPEAQLDQGCIIPGCTDPEACNYDEEATEDDGSCLDICLGCTYPQAVNYDPQANEEDGSCELYDCYNIYSITFTRPNDVNPNLAENQDWITDDVRIARGNDQGLYNAFTDSGWDGNDDGPENTLWKAGEWETGDDPLATYQTWRDHHGGNAQSLPFTTSTIYLIDYDLYFKIEWLSWTCCGNGGGFSYIRTLIPEASGCVLGAAVYGCTNPIADNYDPAAQLDQGCIIPGCTDPEACNYMAEATEDDGSCTDTCPGCTIEGAANYDPTANVDDGSCTVYDCFAAPYTVNFTKADYASPYLEENQDRITDQTWITRGNQQGIYNAFTDVIYDQNEQGPENTLWKFGPWEAGDDPVLDYMTWRDHHNNNPESQVYATSTMFLINEGLYFEIDWLSWTCCGNGGGFSYVRRFVPEAIDCNELAAVYGCTNEIASNYNADATLDDGTCMIDGCTDPEACNFDPVATVDDGSCTNTCPGCTWEGAPNYDPQANVDDGTCLQYTCFEGGAIYEFTKENSVDFDAAENQDRITEDVWIARQNQEGLYNAATDASYSDEALEGPRNTLWKLGPWQDGDDPLNDYGTWYEHHDGNPDNLVGQTSVLYLVDYDYYFQIEWTNWTCCGYGGGFSYIRTFLPTPSAVCDAVAAIYGCNNPIAINFEPLAQANDGSCIIPGCTDLEACNYEADATLDDGSCYYADGDIGLVCPPSINITLYNGETEVEIDYAAPYVTGTCESVIEQAPLVDVPTLVEDNLANITGLITESYIFNYDGGGNQIDDGGGDMYDGGNFLGTNLGSNLIYTGGEVMMNAAFGQSGEVVTMELPGLFVMAADMQNVDFFQITGNLGADGDGQATGEVLSSNDGLMRAYFKRVCQSGDPSVNHLIMIPATAGVQHDWASDTDDDFHRISGISSVNRLYYILWSNQEDVCSSEDEAQDIMQAFLDLVAPSSIELVDGMESGSAFPVGTTTNVWVYADDQGNEYECSFDVSVDLVGCMDDTACNYDANATVDSNQCTYDDGVFDIICGEDIVTYSDQQNNGAYVDYALPQVTGDCDLVNVGASLEDVQVSLNDNFNDIMAVIPNSFTFLYDGGVDYINDGGNDMYDGANYMTTNYEADIDYTSGTIVTSDAFGTDTQYFTEQLNGLFFMGANTDNVEFFQISGNNGADGSGSATGYVLTASTANYTAYYKQVCSAGDPSINHLIIVPSDVPASQTYSDDTNNDEHIVNGLATSTSLYYALWAGNGGYCYTEEEVQTILDALINYAVAPLIYLESGQNTGTFFEIGTTTNVWAVEDNLGNVVTCETTVTVYPYWGCTDPNADNYVPNALMDDGTCFLLDCPEYEGPYSTTFTKQNFADWELEENQDRINNITWITRRNNQGLYNEFDQDGYQTEEGGPSNTQWYLGQTIQQLPYTTWIDGADNNPGVNCNNDSQMALRVIDMNTYFDVTWHHFTGGNNGGGFSYTRVLNLDQSGCDALALIYGCTSMDACNYNADANVEDESCVFPGDECDDGDPETFNDVYTANCDCEGQVGIEEIAPNTLFNVQIRDINGRVVATTQITASSLNVQHLINTDMLSNGIYLLHLTSIDGQYIVKMNVTR